MAILQHNISGELTQELIPAGSDVLVSQISLVNTHASTTCKVDLHIEKKLTGKFYLVKSKELAVGSHFVYKDAVKFNTKNFSLFIKLTKTASETPTVDVIIN
jgi:hypothetical protein